MNLGDEHDSKCINLVNEEIEDIDRLKMNFIWRYRRNYYLSVYSAFIVIVINASIAILAQIEFTNSKLIVSIAAAVAVVMATIDRIFECKDRARRHLQAALEFKALKDRLKYEANIILVEKSVTEEGNKSVGELLVSIARQKHHICQQYLRVDGSDGWISAKSKKLASPS